MKGTAHIVVRDKHGNLKTEVTKHNTITAAMKNTLEAYFSNIAVVSGEHGTKVPRFPVPGKNYFNGIILSDKAVADDCDLQIPVLTGGQTGKSDTSNNTYSASSGHTQDPDKISNTWAWTVGESTQIKSLCLHDSGFSEGFNPFLDLTGQMLYVFQVLKLTSTKRLAARCFSYDAPFLFFGTQKKNLGILGESVADLVHVSTYHNSFNLMYADEVAMFGGATSSQTPNSTWQQLYVFSNNDVDSYSTATPKRSFARTQFNGLATADSGLCSVHPTPENDYLVCWYGTDLKVWIIPRAASSDTIEPIFTTTTTLSGGSNNIGMKAGRTIYGRTLVVNNYNKRAMLLRFDYAENAPVITYKEVLINANLPQLGYSSNYSYYCHGMPIYMKVLTQTETVNAYLFERLIDNDDYAVMSQYPIYVNQPVWHHHTILNLDTPISLAAGDSLTLTYTISASTSTDEGETENSSN